jgi:hypothetical protein
MTSSHRGNAGFNRFNPCNARLGRHIAARFDPGPTRPYSSFFELVKHFSKIVKWVAANGSGAHIAGRAIAAAVFEGKLPIFEGLQEGLVACTAPHVLANKWRFPE